MRLEILADRVEEEF